MFKLTCGSRMWPWGTRCIHRIRQARERIQCCEERSWSCPEKMIDYYGTCKKKAKTHDFSNTICQTILLRPSSESNSDPGGGYSTTEPFVVNVTETLHVGKSQIGRKFENPIKPCSSKNEERNYARESQKGFYYILTLQMQHNTEDYFIPITVA
jgi:hypothetical protein